MADNGDASSNSGLGAEALSLACRQSPDPARLVTFIVHGQMTRGCRSQTSVAGGLAKLSCGIRPLGANIAMLCAPAQSVR